MNNRFTKRMRLRRRGFTLTEVMVGASLAVLILGGAVSIYVAVMRSWREIECRSDADRAANNALAYMVYGVGGSYGLRAASEFSVVNHANGWRLNFLTGDLPAVSNSFVYSASHGTINFEPAGIEIARGVTYAAAVADGQMACVTVRVERVAGRVEAKSEVGTCVQKRNN